MEQKPDQPYSEVNNASKITDNDAAFETDKPMDMPKMEKKCKPWHAVVGIFLGLVVAAAVALPLTLGWFKMKAFDKPRFHMCAEGKCLTVKFDVETKQFTEAFMGLYEDEVKMDDGFEFHGVGSDKNKKGYMAQSFSQEATETDGNMVIYHHAIPFGSDQKISICDMVEQTLPAAVPLENPVSQCELQVNITAGTIKNVKSDGTVTYLAIKEEDDEAEEGDQEEEDANDNDRRLLQVTRNNKRLRGEKKKKNQGKGKGKPKDALIFQAEEYDDWAFYEARKWWDLKEYIQVDWTKNNGPTYAGSNTPYADQEGGYVLCGEFNDRHKYNNYCGVLQGNCVDDADCKSGLSCLAKSEIKDKTVVIPKFHDAENKYCQVKDCAKYTQEDAAMKCKECNKKFTLSSDGLTCTADS